MRRDRPCTLFSLVFHISCGLDTNRSIVGAPHYLFRRRLALTFRVAQVTPLQFPIHLPHDNTHLIHCIVISTASHLCGPSLSLAPPVSPRSMVDNVVMSPDEGVPSLTLTTPYFTSVKVTPPLLCARFLATNRPLSVLNNSHRHIPITAPFFVYATRSYIYRPPPGAPWSDIVYPLA